MPLRRMLLVAAVAALGTLGTARAVDPADAGGPGWTLVDGVVHVTNPAFRRHWMDDQAFLDAISSASDPQAQAAKRVWIKFEADLGHALLAGTFKRDVDAILQKYVAVDYRQHDPNIPDGRAGLAAWLKAGGKHKRPAGTAEGGPPIPIAMIAEGGIVAVMLEAESTAPAAGSSAAGPQFELSQSIFRVRDGRLAEHWEAAQPGAWWCRINCAKPATGH